MIELTREQLNRKIAALREPEPAAVDPQTFDPFARDAPVYDGWYYQSQLEKWVPRHNYLADANAALTLLADGAKELNGASLWAYADGTFSCHFCRRSHAQTGSFCEAVAKAWYYTKTENKVHLID